MRKVLALFVGMMVFAVAGMTEAITIGFDELETPGYGAYYLAGYSIDGFTFTHSLSLPDNFAYFGQDNINYRGSAALLNTRWPSTVTLAMDSGDLFTIHSIDLNRYASTGLNVDFNAFDANNQLVGSLALLLNRDGWFTLDFGPNFEDIAYVEWTQYNNHAYFDNVVLSTFPIPEPASLLLLGSGLLGLAGFGRKKIRKEEEMV